MKKMLFGLIATVMMSVSGNAQKISNEEARLYSAKVMVEFKNTLQPAFNESKSFEEFIKNVTGPYNPQGKITNVGHDVLKVAYTFMLEKVSDDKIVQTYNGLEIGNVFKYLKENPSLSEGSIFGIKSDVTKNVNAFNSTVVNNSNFRCCFFCFRCHLQTVFGEEAGDVILDAIVEAIVTFVKNLSKR
ncbi:hypothetical protein [Flavobacterium difficile]|uniref:Uncharacterized protein n=1 Tax=Flavobacterium difficile TaxID=2709659 RepID=A0ABX0I4V7_9FLAO|nr:hypothetical protein [Flavobacterium difficile]NHM00526.1 hypothetical protein [Flavobacterium difficile]